MYSNYRIDISKDTETMKYGFPFFWKITKNINGEWVDTCLYGWTKTECEAFVNSEIAFNRVKDKKYDLK